VGFTLAGLFARKQSDDKLKKGLRAGFAAAAAVVGMSNMNHIVAVENFEKQQAEQGKQQAEQAAVAVLPRLDAEDFLTTSISGKTGYKTVAEKTVKDEFCVEGFKKGIPQRVTLGTKDYQITCPK